MTGAVRAGLGPRADVQLMSGYHSPQVEVEVRLNTNECGEPPPPEFVAKLDEAIRTMSYNRYPDREAAALRGAVAAAHGVAPEQVWCGNGSNEVLQSLLLAFGGPGRAAAVVEPTYALHSHIARITATDVLVGERAADFSVATGELDRLAEQGPALMFLCSPNNPTGGSEPFDTITHLLGVAPGIVVVDEAYAQFAPRSAIELLAAPAPEQPANLAVVRTFSKTWALAALRLGYFVSSPDIVEAAAKVTLPYHIDGLKQLAGVIALDHEDEMRARVARIVEARTMVLAGLTALDVDHWPSDANFVMFRPCSKSGGEVWQGLLDRSILVRNLSSWPRLTGCLRVTIGTHRECERFLDELAEVLAS